MTEARSARERACARIQHNIDHECGEFGSVICDVADLRTLLADPDLEALRALSERAPVGPWRVVPYGDGDSLVIHDARGDWRVCFMATPGSSPGAMDNIEAAAEMIC
jgi:hypothetical protein